MTLEEIRQNKHQENLETLVYFGADGLSELLFKIKNIMTLLEGSSSDVNVTVKIDGSPAIVMYSDFPGLEGPGVSWKSLPTTLQKGRSPHIFRTEQDVMDYTHDKPDSDTLGRSPQSLEDALRLGLMLAKSIPPGEMWQGDVLWGPGSKKHFQDESTGDDWIYFKPNTLIYAAASDSNLGKTIAEKDFGITLHTKYSSFFKQSFDISIEALHDIPNSVFAMKAEEIKIEPGTTTFTAEESAVLKDMIDEIEILCNELLSGSGYQEILDDKLLSSFMQFASAKCYSQRLEFKNSIDKLRKEFGESIAKRYKVQKNLEDTLDYLRDQIESRANLIETIVELTVAVLDVKIEFIKKMNSMSQFAAKTDLFGKIESTYQEGFTVSDIDGQVVKLVDNDTFTRLNLLTHGSPNAKLTERVNSDGSLTVYTATKTENLGDFFLKHELKFGLNSGSTYGDGIYTILDLDNDTNYHEDTLKQLYGSHIFEFKTNPAGLFFFLFDEFKKTKLCKKLKSTFDTFIADQVKHFKLDLPAETIGQMQPDPSDKTWPSVAKNAAAFYKAIKENYYQNADGTLNTPLNGFVYNGKNDGNVGVFWNPYSLIPQRVTHDGGETWTDIDSSSEEYQQYMKEAQRIAQNPEFSEDTRIANSSRIFAGDQTPEKQAVYRLVKNIGGAMGSVSNIVVKDGEVDFKFRSNSPQAHSSLHGIKVAKGELNELHSLGFSIGTLDGGLCFGSSSKGAPVYKVEDSKYFDLIPKEITKGIRFSNMTLSTWHIPVDMIGEKTATINECTIIGIDGLNDYDSIVIDYGRADKPKYCYVANEKIKKAIMKKLDKDLHQYLKGNSIDESTDLVNRFLREKVVPFVKEEPKAKTYVNLLRKEKVSPAPIHRNEELLTGEFWTDNAKLGSSSKGFYMLSDDFDDFVKAAKKDKSLDVEQAAGSHSNDAVTVSIKGDGTNDEFKYSETAGTSTTMTKEGKTLALKFESLVFNHLYIGSGNEYESKNNPEESKEIKVATDLAKKPVFARAAVQAFNELVASLVAVCPPIKSRASSIRVYYAANNKTPAFEKTLAGWVDQTNAIIEKLSEAWGVFRTNITLFQKADVVLSVLVNKKDVIWIPVSIKQTLAAGNKGSLSYGSFNGKSIYRSEKTYTPEEAFANFDGFCKAVFGIQSLRTLVTASLKPGAKEKNIYASQAGTMATPLAKKLVKDIVNVYSGDGMMLYCCSKDKKQEDFESATKANTIHPEFKMLGQAQSIIKVKDAVLTITPNMPPKVAFMFNRNGEEYFFKLTPDRAYKEPGSLKGLGLKPNKLIH